jgi:hypothetical protein
VGERTHPDGDRKERHRYSRPPQKTPAAITEQSLLAKGLLHAAQPAGC